MKLVSCLHSTGFFLYMTKKMGTMFFQKKIFWKWHFNGYECNKQCYPSITDGVHRNENFEEIIPVFSSFSKFLKKYKKKI